MVAMTQNITPLRRSGKHTMDAFLANQGMAAVITVPQVYITLAGDYEAAFVLAQVLYWQEICAHPEGWVYKSEKEWKQEWNLSLYKINKIVTVLAPFGLEYKVAAVNNIPKMHFHVNVPLLQNSILKFFQNAKNAEDSQDEHSQENEECPPDEHYQNISECKPKNLQDAFLKNSQILQTQTTAQITSTDEAPDGATHAQARASPEKTSAKNREIEIVPEDDTRFKIAVYFRDKLLDFAPELVMDIPAATPKGLAKWCDFVRLLLARYDKRTIGQAIDFVFADTRWWAGKMDDMKRFHRDFKKIYTDMCAAQKRGEINGQAQTGRSAPARGIPAGSVIQSNDQRKAAAHKGRAATSGT